MNLRSAMLSFFSVILVDLVYPIVKIYQIYKTVVCKGDEGTKSYPGFGIRWKMKNQKEGHSKYMKR